LETSETDNLARAKFRWGGLPQLDRESLLFLSALGEQLEPEDTTPNQRTFLFLDNIGHIRSSQTACGLVAFSSHLRSNVVPGMILLSSWSFRGRVASRVYVVAPPG
jgi:hypothetical protein